MVTSRPNIWQLQSRRDADGLVAALRYPDPEVRRRAAAALQTMDAVQAIPALKAALMDEVDPQARLSLARALHELDHRTDIEGMIRGGDVRSLIHSLNSRRPESAIAAARALGKLGNRLAVEPLVILFHTSSAPPSVRLAAAEALLELKSAPAVVTLLGALRRDSWQVRRNAAAVLGQIQAVWAVEPLAEAMNDPHPIVRRTAAAALKRIGTAQALAALRAGFGGQAVENVPPSPASAPVPVSASAPKVAPPPVRPVLEAVEPVPVPQPVPVPPSPILPRVAELYSPPSQTGSMPPGPEPRTRLAQPIKRLIAFLKQRNA